MIKIAPICKQQTPSLDMNIEINVFAMGEGFSVICNSSRGLQPTLFQNGTVSGPIFMDMILLPRRIPR